MDPQQQRSRTGRFAAVAAGVVASAVLAAGPGHAVGPAADPPAPRPAVPTPAVPAITPPAPPVSSPIGEETPVPPEDVHTLPAPVTGPDASAVPPAPAEPPGSAAGGTGGTAAFGAYLDYGALGVSRMSELSRWLGGAGLSVGHTYLPGDRWSNIEGAPGFLDVWADWRRAGDDRTFVLNVPMLERNEDHVPDDEVRGLLARGAAGEFDGHFRALADRLVRLGVPDTVIVLGWEMNGITYTHRCGPDPEAWKKYWNRIVTTMRSVPGQEFRFDFAPNRGRDAIPWTRCYPGDDTVDIIGMDSYDQPRGISFDEQVKEPYGLQDQVDFAEAHGKPISYPEWGLFRNGDNATYMRRMLTWMDEHKPVYNTLTDYCPHGVWQCHGNPRASRVYRAMMSGRTGPAETPGATPPAVPAVPAAETGREPSPDCSPVPLGAWAEHWMGRKLCLRLGWWPGER
ncbi:glycoside hydrolase family 26 protein [Streptomyces sp. NPDC008313]|uniref:glycoside hydrolase family 26 protein n=1 Tax=Streptomyces sp. NPDC008313 TaxID=3364826 RepID=UPI0036EA545B